MAIGLDPKKSHLLAVLPEAERQRWLPHLEPVQMPLGQVLDESGRTLQVAGLIRYGRGRINVIDREGLEQRSCECYELVKNECDGLLPNRLAI